jgi:peptidoglycan-N-acetylglucosamine deacetylase
MPPRITLTFDNGPVPGITDRVLEILDRAGILSTFFVIGRKLDDSAAASLMQEAHSAGHWIGNHTYTHSVALGDRPDADHAAREIGYAQDRIGDFSHPDKLFRPYGNSGLIGPHLLSKAAISYLLAARFRTIVWNCVPGDWKDPEGWVESCVSQVSARDWSVVVLHDIHHACLPRLPELFRRLNDIGAIYEQDYPASVMLTRAGTALNIPAAYIGG